MFFPFSHSSELLNSLRVKLIGLSKLNKDFFVVGILYKILCLIKTCIKQDFT